MDISDIEKESNRLRNDLDKSNKKFYHLNSVGNFLFHFDSLNDTNSKKHVLNLLNELFNYYHEHSIGNTQESLIAFQEYIKPIGLIYERQLGFFILVKPWLLTLVTVLGYVIIFFVLNNNFIVMTSFLTLVLVFVLYEGMKFYQRKLYAFLW